MKGNSTMSAIEAFKAHIHQVATLGDQGNQIGARIRQIQGIANEAQAPVQQAASLKAKRRSILARVFLGTGDNSELSGTEKAIVEAEAAAMAKAPNREGAEAAIEELQREASAIAQEIHAIARDRADLYHAALMEYAKEAIPAYQEAEANLVRAYAELIGRCRAVDLNADPQQGRYFAAAMFPNQLEVPPAPTFSNERYKTHIDASEWILAARDRAKQHMDAIAMQATNVTNQSGATK